MSFFQCDTSLTLDSPSLYHFRSANFLIEINLSTDPPTLALVSFGKLLGVQSLRIDPFIKKHVLKVEDAIIAYIY